MKSTDTMVATCNKHYEWRRMRVLNAKPNAGHYAIAQLADYVERLALVTQNVDDLHERAGSRSVIHLHGSLHHPRCFACARPYEFPQGIPNVAAGGGHMEPPRCSYCNGYIRPGVVWFGEVLPKDAWQQAEDAALACDVIVVIGTSSLVWPAAKLPDMAAIRGAKIIQINPNSTSLDSKANYNYRGNAGEVLPALVKALSDFLG
jgi:NAD-dependent deacetylase